MNESNTAGDTTTSTLPATTAQTTTSPELLGLHSYWQAVGKETMEEVLTEAKVSWGYFKAIAYFTRPCGKTTFEKILRAANKITPGTAPDYETCTRQSIRDEILQARSEARNKRINVAKVVEQAVSARRTLASLRPASPAQTESQ